MNYGGIDPGREGAIATIEDDGTARVDPLALGPSERCRQIQEWSLLYNIRLLIIEEQRARTFLKGGQRFMQKGSSTMMKNYGILLGALYTLHIPLEEVLPSIWRKTIFKGWPKATSPAARKRQSIEKAQQLFPDVSLLRTERCEKPDHNMAEALLLAELARRPRR